MRTIIPDNAVLVPDNANCVFRGKIFDVYQWPQSMFDGSEETFEMLKRPDTVKVIAIRDDKIVLLRQEQPNLPPFYDIPGGRHDGDGETELQAAQRELLEETGLKFKQWRLVNVEQPHTKIDWIVYTFIAFDFDSETSPVLEPGERIAVDYLALKEMKALLYDSKTRHLPTTIIEQAQTIDDILALAEYKETKSV